MLDVAIPIDELHYVDFAEQGEEGPGAANEVRRHLHAFNRDKGNHLGFDFQEWKIGTRAPKLTQIRVFGKKELLLAFIKQPRSLRLMATGCVSRTAILPVPKCDVFVTVSRDSSADKVKPSHARRRMNRGGVPYEQPSKRADLTLYEESKSNGNTFPLRLKKQEASQSAFVTFNSYGLCMANSAIPSF